jgi:glycosyltransferase involved in cell wall biosynthesis
VIAFRRGSMPELISDGSTGFVVDDVEQAVEAVLLARSLARGPIREQAVARFGRDRMVDQYLATYSRVLEAPTGR